MENNLFFETYLKKNKVMIIFSKNNLRLLNKKLKIRKNLLFYLKVLKN